MLAAPAVRVRPDCRRHRDRLPIRPRRTGARMDKTLHDRLTRMAATPAREPRTHSPRASNRRLRARSSNRTRRPLHRRRRRPRHRRNDQPRPVQPLRRPARRYGRAADPGNQRRAPRLHQPQRHACLRPRRPHHLPARCRGPAGDRPNVVRHRTTGIPASRGRRRGRQKHDRRRPIRAFSDGAHFRLPQLAWPGGGNGRHPRWSGHGCRQSRCSSPSPVIPATPRCRT